MKTPAFVVETEPASVVLPDDKREKILRCQKSHTYTANTITNIDASDKANHTRYICGFNGTTIETSPKVSATRQRRKISAQGAGKQKYEYN